MPDSLNTQLADALTERQLEDARVETTQRRWLWAALAVLEADLLAALKTAELTAPALLARRKRRVQRLIEEEVAPLVTSRYALIAEGTAAALTRLAHSEAAAVVRLTNEVAGAKVLSVSVSVATLRKTVTETLFPSAATATDLSATFPTWWARQGAALQQRVSDQLTVSVSLEETETQAIARLRGTAEKAFTDGVMARAREDAARLLRTAVTNTVSETRAAVAKANSEAIEALEHSSVMDSKTSSICQGRDGLRYTVETHEPLGHAVSYLSGIPYHPS